MVVRIGRLYLLLLIVALAWSVPSTARADVLDDIDTVLNNFNTYYQAPSYVRGPGSTYLSFGAFRTFVPRHTYQLLSITPPSFRATCGGIDVFMGGFSFINLDQFPQMLQQIMSSAAGYFFQLAMEQLCPTCANVLSIMRHAAQLANKFALDSCAAGHMLAKSAVDAIFANAQQETIERKREENNKSFLENLNDFMNKIANSDLSDIDQTVQRWKNEADNATSVELHCGNLVFLALKKVHPTTAAEEASVAMSLLGTAIAKCGTNGQVPIVDPLSPTIKNPEVLISGCHGDECSKPTGGNCAEGEIPLWVCDDTTKCLNPHVQCKSLAQVFTAQTAQKLRTLIDKILNNQAPTPEEQALYFHVPYLAELYGAIREYKDDARTEILYSFADGLGSEALAYIMLRDILNQAYGGLVTQIAAIRFAKNLNMDEYKRAFDQRFQAISEKLDDRIKTVKREIERRIQVYASLKQLNYKEFYSSAAKAYETKNVERTNKK